MRLLQSAIPAVLIVAFIWSVATGCGTESETWEDEASGLMWTTKGAGAHVTQQGAQEHCKGLSLDGHSDWQAPTVDELRTLIQGCPATAPGGKCKLTQACNQETKCYAESACRCEYKKGPFDGGCYVSGELIRGETCGDTMLWSRTIDDSGGGCSYALSPSDGGITCFYKSTHNKSVRCVRKR